MTADARIKQIALIAVLVGWPALGLLYLFTGFGAVLDWSVIALIGLTIGLAMRWLTDRLGLQ